MAAGSGIISSIDVLKILYKNPCGYIRDLEGQIGPEQVRQIEAIGYIVNAPSEEGYTYRTSSKARQIADGLFGPSTIGDSLSDFYYRNVKRVRFSL